MTTDPNADLVEMLLAASPEYDREWIEEQIRDRHPITLWPRDLPRLLTWANARAAETITPTDREMLDQVLGRLATLPGWTMGDYSDFLGRLIAWANGRRDAAVGEKDAEIAQLTAALEMAKTVFGVLADDLHGYLHDAAGEAINDIDTALSGGGVAGWRPTSEAPQKPGTYINVRNATTYRWLEYKPEGKRQMKVNGRWQRATEYGWENAPLPNGEFQPATETREAGRG